LNIVPYLDILMNLIIFLLASMQSIVSLSYINATAPSYGDASQNAGQNEDKKEKLNLTVAITEKGFYVAGTGGVLANEQSPEGAGGPTVPVKAGQYDFPALTTLLAKVKQSFPDETRVILTPESRIKYDVVIHTMDAMRQDKAK